MNAEKLLSKKEQDEIRQIKIEKKDERNISLGNAAKARAYELMICLYNAVVVILAILNIITLKVFFIFFGLFIICQIYFIIRLYRYHKKM